VTQAIVDQVLDDPGSLIALTTIKELDRHLISHSVNVAILSVCLGQRLGLNKSRLGELCLAAFMHDAGKLEVTRDVLDKPGPLDPQELEEMRKHPVGAARALLSGHRLTVPTMRAVVVAYEHHLNYDMSGYPPSQIRDRVSLFGNMVAIADRYDALTTRRRYRRYGYTPHEVVGYLVHYAGTFFDPLLVKLFVAMIGLYPPGTLVGLDTGDVGVVCGPPVVGQPLDRPRVRLWTGERVGHVVDLSEQSNGTYALSVALILNPADMGQVPAMELSDFETDR
jgi:HD-GYP domain-containing protein (c-di-GMP phosphodiesterase class II)